MAQVTLICTCCLRVERGPAAIWSPCRCMHLRGDMPTCTPFWLAHGQLGVSGVPTCGREHGLPFSGANWCANMCWSTEECALPHHPCMLGGVSNELLGCVCVVMQGGAQAAHLSLPVALCCPGAHYRASGTGSLVASLLLDQACAYACTHARVSCICPSLCRGHAQ